MGATALPRNCKEAGQLRQLDILRKGTYTMTQDPDEERIQIEFFEGRL